MRIRCRLFLGLFCLAGGSAGAGPPSPSVESPAGGDEAAAAAPCGILGGDGAFLLAWESRSGPEADILFSRREPGVGGGWFVGPRRLDTDERGVARSLEPRLAAGPGKLVFAVWQDSRSGKDDVRFNRSTDGGLTWLGEDVRLNTARAGEGAASMPAIAADRRGRVWVVWEDRRDGARDIRLNRSTDAGLTWWSEDRRLDSDAAGAGVSYHPQIAVREDGTVFVCWWDERDGLADLYVRRSPDGGETWPEAELRLDPGPAGETASRGAHLAVAGEHAAIAWEEIHGASPAAIYVSASLDPGDACLLAMRPCPRAQGRDPRVWLGPDGGGVVVWVSASAGAPLEWSRFRTPQGTLPSGPLGGPAPAALVEGAPWLGGAGGVLWLAWIQGPGEGGAGERGVGLVGIAESRNTGGSWRLRTGRREYGGRAQAESAIRTDDHPAATAHSLTGAVAADGVLHLAWVDSRGPRSQVRAIRLEPAEEPADEADE